MMPAAERTRRLANRAPKYSATVKRAAAPQVPAEKQRADDVADDVDGDERQHQGAVAGVRHAGLAEECRRAQEARHQRAEDQQCRRLPARDEVVLEVADLAPGPGADRQVQGKAGEYPERGRDSPRSDAEVTAAAATRHAAGCGPADR